MSSCEDLIADGHFIEDWSAEECGDFIENAGYPQYRHTFVFNGVTGAELWTLEQHYLSRLGIRNFKEQKLIMGYLKQLRQQEEEQKIEEVRRQEEQEREEEARRQREQEQVRFLGSKSM